VTLGEADCLEYLARADHGVLSTLHPDRLIDSVPACFALVGRHLFVPVDRVKPKASTSLRRAANLAREPRATLLCEHWDRHDWSRLSWVRANLVWLADGVLDPAELGIGADRLREKYVQYRSGAFAAILPFRVVAVTGWSAAG